MKEGKYPEKMQEIAAGRAFFRAMGYGDVKIGDTVTLDYRAGMQSEYKPEEFVAVSYTHLFSSSDERRDADTGRAKKLYHRVS